MDCIFNVAIALLPFDNLFFAPSVGWATITPIILFIYILFNIKYTINVIKKYSILFIIFIIMILFSAFDFLICEMHISSIIDTISTLFLGISSLIAFEIYFVSKKNRINPIIKILVVSYTISLIIGWIQFFAIKFEITTLFNLFDIISKRNYMWSERVQFTFTEPSFIGMHIFGVLLPLYFVTREKKILKIMLCFVISNIIFDSSLRFIIDSTVILSIFLTLYLIRKKRILTLIVATILIIFSVRMIYISNDRINSIINKGIYADNSLAARYFRIMSSIYGYFNEPSRFIFGYGMGNSILPMKSGYIQALYLYNSNYTGEIEQIINPNNFDSNASFCLYTRMISEYGIIIFVLIGIYFYKLVARSNFQYKYEFLLVFLYLYLQFDSFAFYTLWIFIMVLSNYKKILNK